MSFLRNVNPTGAISELWFVFKQAGPNRWRFAALAAVGTVAILSVMTGQNWKKRRPLPEITYITAWPEHRTNAETQAFITENQRRKDEREALLREQEKVGQDLWMAVGRASGVDVDRMKAQADADRAAADAAAKAKAEAMLAATRKAPVER